MEPTIDAEALRKLSYGLFVLTAREGTRDNGCIINTCMQVTDVPKRMLITVNKRNYTTEQIKRTGLFNVNVLTEETPFSVFQHFGFQSGRLVNKFEACETEHRTENGLLYLPKYINACLSGRVVNTMDCGSHLLFLADVTEARAFLSAAPATYAYYFSHIKPAAGNAGSGKKIKGWVCKICGYVYEGETLPPDFLCPLCGHGPDDFEPVYE